MFFLFPALIFSQVEKDEERPFGQGQLVLVPGTVDYLGDLSHEISLEENPDPYHTIIGWLSTRAGWPDSLGQNQVGLHATAPGLLFDEIPYPFDSSKIINWMPTFGTVEVLDFPAQAWWGTSSSVGTIHLQALDIPKEASQDITLWGGSGGTWGGLARYNNTFLGATLSSRQSIGNPFSNGSNDYSFSAKVKFYKTDDWDMTGTLLAAQSSFNDYWYVASGSINWNNGNFQNLQVKPYFQAAQVGNQTTQVAGVYLNYGFNLGGLAENHFRVGESYSYSGGLKNGFLKGFIQNADSFDILGIATMDSTFRLDYSQISSTIFSALIGLQVPHDSFTFLGDFGNGVSPIGDSVNQADFGIRYMCLENLSVTGKYIHDNISANTYDGGRFQLDWEDFFSDLFYKLRFQANVQVLMENGLKGYSDYSGSVNLDLVKEGGIWAKGRAIGAYPFYAELGGFYSFFKATRAFITLANLSGQPVSWPDSDLALGLVFWSGVDIRF